MRAIDAGEVAALVVIGGNPVYTAPADREIARRWRSLPVVAHIGLYENETSSLCRWFAPAAHFLEAWSDARAFDGTASIAQPLMRPLAEGKTAGQVLAALGGDPEATSRGLVESYWRARAPAGDTEAFWQQALVRGIVEGSQAPAVAPVLDWGPLASELATPRAPRGSLEIVYFADARVHDGRFADNAWLQELGDPVTKLAWDNAALLSPTTAARMDVASEDIVELEVRGRTLRAPALVLPGTADDVVAIALGYGQTMPGRVSTGVGANAYALRDSRALWSDDVSLRKTGGSWPLALTQEHWSMEGRPIVLCRTLEEYRKDPGFAKPHNEKRLSLYGVVPSAPHQWGMTIDLNACTGCSACVIACMAENNIPVVGKDGVRLSREMQWIRIDRYLTESSDQPAALLQPMLCQHCEKAPCEYVCPVNATVHSSDGLNEMVYNRCVGTRFCSNNCPYKVRRFNFFNYNADKPETLALAMNPDVTVRARGVMEKCTYCVQRIREVEIRSRREQRPIRDLEIQTACQQTCPTGAIVFGDIADGATRVAATRTNERLYAVLDDLGTLPRTRYLARVFNPNPELRRE
jgi:molybdopterin-containing oxidoreductase family iron-sulfur binding subunit